MSGLLEKKKKNIKTSLFYIKYGRTVHSIYLQDSTMSCILILYVLRILQGYHDATLLMLLDCNALDSTSDESSLATFFC